MKTIKTSEAQGRALDWLVAKALGFSVKVRDWQAIVRHLDPNEDADLIAFHKERGTIRVSVEQLPGSGWHPNKRYSSDWAHGGQIIEQEGIGLLYDAGSACRKPSWFATTDDQCTIESYEGEHFDPAFLVAESAGTRGPTPLIAAMRCYVASKLGETVEVPEELL